MLYRTGQVRCGNFRGHCEHCYSVWSGLWKVTMKRRHDRDGRLHECNQPSRVPACRMERLEGRCLFAAGVLPRPDHIVIVVEEDHSYDQILGDPVATHTMWPWVAPELMAEAPYIRGLAGNGASFTRAHSVGNPSGLTYQALFSGLTPTAHDRPWLHPYQSPNLASELISAGLSFAGYSESLPRVGYVGGDVGDYKRAHNPWVNFANVPVADNLPFSKFPADYNKLPTVSFVVPNLQDNMHSSTVQEADNWLADHLSGYARWASSHNSLLIVTWDESHTSGGSIPTIFYGPMVEQGNYADRISQTNILRTVEDMYGLAPTGTAAVATPITDIFQRGGVSDPQADAAEQLNAARSRRHRGGGSIHGIVFDDRLGTHRPTHGNPRLAGWLVYLDLNGDGKFGPDEPAIDTDSKGRFLFRHVAPGTYTVRLVPRDGYAPSASLPDAVQVTVTGHPTPRLLFSEEPI